MIFQHRSGFEKEPRNGHYTPHMTCLLIQYSLETGQLQKGLIKTFFSNTGSKRRKNNSAPYNLLPLATTSVGFMDGPALTRCYTRTINHYSLLVTPVQMPLDWKDLKSYIMHQPGHTISNHLYFQPFEE